MDKDLTHDTDVDPLTKRCASLAKDGNTELQVDCDCSEDFSPKFKVAGGYLHKKNNNMVSSLSPTSPRGAILYVDHANHLTPLTLTYHATASRHLTSGRSDVIPPSTSVEVDSAYCPRCLTCCDAASAASLGVCQKDITDEGSFVASCKDCPVCFAPVAISIDAVSSSASTESTTHHLVCHYICGHCRWSSQECGVTSNADKLLEYPTQTDASMEKEYVAQRQTIISSVSRELELNLRQRVNAKNKLGEDIFSSVVNMWGQKEQDEERRRRMNIGSYTQRAGSSVLGGQSWSLETLEQLLLEKKKEIASPYISSDPAVSSSRDFADRIDIDTTKQQMIPTPQQTAAQKTITTTSPRFRSDLFPLPVTYRSRVSRRCIAEQEAGRTGILVKPKLNPLEGDSSLKFGHGQWWKKDSSAVQMVPRIQLCRHETDSSRQQYAVLLKIRNPTLSMIRLRLSGLDEGDSAKIDARELDNVLVDPFRGTFVKAHLCTPEITSSLAPTDWFTLDNTEDSLLGKREDDPPEIEEWNALTAMSEGEDNSKLRVVATRRDTAWVELILKDAAATSDGDGFLAVPMSMHIEVGNGSWEASLIKHRDLPGGEMDLVTLNAVALLR